MLTNDDGSLPFRALLARLAEEGEPGEVVYERLRKRLITHLRLHVAAEAHNLADVALDRMARRIGEGTAVDNVYLYALGIARLLVHEFHARAAREQRALREIASNEDETHDFESSQDADEAARALSECMERLGKAGVDLIMEYYAAGDGSARIKHRRRMAARLGIQMNALRNRVLRLRELLERCAYEKLGWHDGSPRGDTSSD